MNIRNIVGSAAFAAAMSLASAQANEACDTTLIGPGIGSDIQAAIDSAAPGSTLCLDGQFTSVALLIRDTVGLTLRSKNKNTPATLSNNTSDIGQLPFGLNGLTLFNTDAITIRDLNIEVIGQHAINGAGANSNITVMGNNTVGGIVANNVDVDADWTVSSNVIHAGDRGIGGFNSPNFMVKDNYIVLDQPPGPNPFSGGIVITSIGLNGRTPVPFEMNGIKIMDNTVELAREESRPNWGIAFDTTLFSQFGDAEHLIANADLKRNTSIGFDVGIQAHIVGGDLTNDPTMLSDFDLLRNTIACGAGAGSIGIELIASDNGFIDDVQLINNTASGCETEILTTGDVTNVKVLGKASKTNGAWGSARKPSSSETSMQMNNE